MSIREKMRRCQINKRISKSGVFIDDGRLRIGLRFQHNEKDRTCQVGKIEKKLFRKPKLSFGKEEYMIELDKFFNISLLRIDTKTVFETVFVRGCSISFHGDPHILRLELEEDPKARVNVVRKSEKKDKKKKTNIRVKFLRFKKIDVFCFFTYFLTKKLGCKLISRFERNSELESRIVHKLYQCGIDSSKIPDIRILYDPDFIRHYFLSVHEVGIKYRGEYGWNVTQFVEWENHFHVFFSELNYEKTPELLLEEILEPLQTHDITPDYLEKLKSESINDFNVSCSIVCGPFYFDFSKFGFIIPRRVVGYGSIFTAMPCQKLPVEKAMKQDLFSIISRMISDWNTKYVFHPSPNLSKKKIDLDVSERIEELSRFFSKETLITLSFPHKIIVPKFFLLSTCDYELEIGFGEDNKSKELQFEKRTCVDFVFDFMNRLQISPEENFYRYPEQSVARYFFDKIENEGYAKSVTSIRLDEEFKSKLLEENIFKEESEYSGVKKDHIIIESHRFLDMLFKLIKERIQIPQFHQRQGIVRDKFEYINVVFGSLDRMFWIRHFADPSIEKWRPMGYIDRSIRERNYKSECPFIHPKHFWMGYNPDQLFGDY